MPKVTKEVFDSRRFTFVGDVSVTEKGIASGFSSSSYVTFPCQNLGDNFDIIFPSFKTSDVSSFNVYLFYISGLRVRLYNAKMDTVYYYASDSYLIISSLTTLKNNTEYLYRIKRTKDGSNYIVTAFLSNDNGASWVQQSRVTTQYSLYDETKIGYLGGSPDMGTNIYKEGSIDLKQLSITVDGEVIFDNSIITVERIEPLLHRSSISKETKVVYDSTDFDTYGSIVVDKNGIASGFSTGGNRVEDAVSIVKASTSKVTIKGQWTYGTSSGDVAMMWMLWANKSSKTRQEILADGSGTQISTASSTIVNVTTFDTALVAGDVIDIEATIDFANNTFNETLTVNNSKTYTINATVSWTSVTYTYLVFGLYNSDGSTYKFPWDGTIDLKTIEVTVDGKTIIKGSKTVTVTNQTLKAVKGDKAFDKSKFTIVGSPTITDDGVASGFSKNNDVETNFTLSNLLNKKWSIDITGTLGDMSRNSVLFSVSQTVKWSGFGGAYITAKGSCSVQVAVGTGSQQEIDKQVLWAQAIFSSYDVVRVVLSYDGIDEYSAQVFKNGTLIKTGTYTAPTADKNLYLANLHPNEFINIGDGWQADSTSNFCWLGSIDLKQFSITVDGKEVFSGTKDIYKAFI